MKKSEFKKIAMENFKNLNMSDVHKTRLYKYDNIPIKRIKKPTITFIYKTTTEAVDNAYKYYPGYKISILNFADGETVGGGYLNGAKAQEEDLCRKIPELYTSLLHSKKECYPFGPSTSYGYSRVLFTRNMLIKRDKNLKYIKNHNKWRNVSVVSAAAPNIGYKNEDYDVAKIKNTIDNIFNVPYHVNKDKILILGAWGCGAFGNDPVEIASLFRDAILKGAASNYTAIYFAIPGVHNDSTSHNSYVFYQILKEAGLIKYTVK